MFCYFSLDTFSNVEISHFKHFLNCFYLTGSIPEFSFPPPPHFYCMLPQDPAITSADSMHSWNNLLAQGKQELCRLPFKASTVLKLYKNTSTAVQQSWFLYKAILQCNHTQLFVTTHQLVSYTPFNLPADLLA